MYLLDTNTLIYFFKGQGDVAVHLFAHTPKDIFIPTIVLFELEVGIAKSNGLTLISRNLSEFEKVNGLKVENWF